MKIFTMIMAIAILAATDLSAQHNKNFINFIKVEVKMNYAGEAIDIIINGKAVIELKNSIA